MKCPKCAYVGFNATDRCRHCGYDFSLMGSAAAPTSTSAATAIDVDPRPVAARGPEDRKSVV